MVEIRNLNDEISVAPQIDAADIEAIHDAGFKSIICNRPDQEAADQPDYDGLSALATDLGMEFHYLPITPGQMNPEQISHFGAIIESAPKPILAYCRTGTRSTTLWALSQAGRFPAAELIERAKAAGYDLSPLAARLP